MTDDLRQCSLVVDGVSKSFGSRLLLNDVSLTVRNAHRVGVVGRNGVGKTTLLQIMAGFEQPDSGRVHRNPPSANVGYLPQEVVPVAGETLREYLRRRTGVADAERELERLAGELARGADVDETYSEQLDRVVSLGSGDFYARVPQVLEWVGHDVAALDREMAGMSGGQLARAALAAILLSRFDVLLIDEPTNNLDFGGLEQLERFIEQTSAGVVVVSHDRAFLERTVTHVLDIDHGSHEATLYGGGWQSYLTERAQARQRQFDKHEQYEAERKRLEEAIRRKREWARKGAAKAKNRAADNNKAARKGKQEHAENLAGGNRALERRLERLEVVEEPYKGWELRFSIGEAERSGRLVAQLRSVVVDRGHYRLGPVDLDVQWQDRIGLVGPNGVGKSTVVGLLLGLIEPTRGEVRMGSNVHIGRLDQNRAMFEGSQLLDGVRGITGLAPQQARSLLAKFDLGERQVERPFDELSPGERTRAELAVLMHERINFLVLDEPTNHLDLLAIEQLEKSLPQFRGTLLLVTHDRQLLERTRLNRRAVLEEETHDRIRHARVRESTATHRGD